MKNEHLWRDRYHEDSTTRQSNMLQYGWEGLHDKTTLFRFLTGMATPTLNL